MVTVMTWRNQRLLLFSAAAALVAAALFLLAWALFLPLDRGDERDAARKKTQPDMATTRKMEPLGAYAVIYQRDLRKPLFDSEAAKVDTPSPPPLTVTLKGTVVEDGFSYAILRGKGGDEKLLRVGDSLEGAEVIAIAEGEATVRFHDQNITLKAQLKEGP
jgi:hypothetical protein